MNRKVIFLLSLVLLLGQVSLESPGEKSSSKRVSPQSHIKLSFGIIADVHHTTIPHTLALYIVDKSQMLQNFASDMNSKGARFVISDDDLCHEGYNGAIESRYNKKQSTDNTCKRTWKR